MSKYELAVVVSAKLEDDARAEVIEKVKALVTRFGGNITDVDEWGKKRLAYENPEDERSLLLLHSLLNLKQQHQAKSKKEFVSWMV